jgi:hypothetical protein
MNLPAQLTTLALRMNDSSFMRPSEALGVVVVFPLRVTYQTVR